MNRPLVIVSCAGSFERNASVLRALAVARWHQAHGELGFLALERTEQNVTLALKFGLASTRLRSIAHIFELLWRKPEQPLTVHLVNVSIKNASLAVITGLAGGRVVADWDEWASKIPAPALRKLMWRSVETLMFHLADTFIVASRFLRSEIQQELGRSADVAYIPYGFDLPAVTASVAGELPPGKRYLAYVGSFSANYAADIAELFRVALAAATDGVELLVIGDGELLPQLRDGLATQGGRAHFLGRMTPAEVDRWLLHPQIVAGFLPLQRTRQNLARCPNKLFHYIRASLPVITSELGEAQEALGENGVYYEFGDEAGLRRAIGSALACRPCYEMGRYSWSSRLAGLERISRDAGDKTMIL